MNQDLITEINTLTIEEEQIFARVRGEKRQLSKQEQDRVADLDLRAHEIEVELRKSQFSEELTSEPLTQMRGDLPGSGHSSNFQSFSAGVSSTTSVALKADRSWREMCRRTGTAFSNDGWREPGEFYSAMVSGQRDSRMKFSQLEGIDSQGGFAVPPEYAAGIMDSALERELIRPGASIYPMRAKELKVTAWDAETHTGSSLYGGISAHWESEGSSLSTDEAKLRQIGLLAKKLAFLGKASTELLEDSATFASDFQAALTKSASFFLDQAFLQGSGAGRPLGILNSPCLITVSAEAGQTAGTVVHENFVKMWARCLPESRSRSVWIIHNDLIPDVLSLSFAVGTGGVPSPVYDRSSGTILSRPVLFTEKLPAAGSLGDVLLVDRSAYGIGMRTEIQLVISPHVHFQTDEIAFRLRVRIDGQPLLDQVVTPVSGNTLSPFVTLAAR